MEPIPESREVVDDYGPFADTDLLVDLAANAERVREIVPDCVGLSLAIFAEDVVITLVATSAEIASLDAVQYMNDGPCLQAVRTETTLGFDQEHLFDEGDWHLFARATAASGVMSTLTLPIRADGQVTGSINLYAASRSAFDTHHEAIADIFGAWAHGAVADADLAFTTRDRAREEPARHHAEIAVTRATALLGTALSLDYEVARQRMQDSARRAGVNETRLAEFLIGVLAEDHS